MPTYSFENKKTGQEWTDIMTIAEKEKYLKKHKNVKQIITAVNIVSGTGSTNIKNDAGWNENLQRISEAHPTSNLADRYGKKSAKDIKTRQVIEKHIKRQKAQLTPSKPKTERHQMYQKRMSAEKINYFNRNRKTTTGRGAADGGAPKNKW